MPLKKPFEIATKTTPNHEIEWRYFVPGIDLQDIVMQQQQRDMVQNPALEMIARYFMEIKSEFSAEDDPIFDKDVGEHGEVVFQFPNNEPPAADWVQVDTELQTGWVPPHNNPLRMEYQSALALVHDDESDIPTLRSLIGNNKFATPHDPLELNATPRTYLMAGHYYIAIPYVAGQVEYETPHGLIEITADEYEEAQMADKINFATNWQDKMAEIRSRPAARMN